MSVQSGPWPDDAERDDFDSPWKDALQLYFQDFLAFFYPAIHADIDWTRGYDSLDKEFQQIVRRAKVGKGIADKLFKVWLLDGAECWLLIHVEVQGTYDVAFAERMFRYNVAAYALYNREVVSLAVLCDANPAWRPEAFGYGRWGSWTGTRFLTVKLLDHAGAGRAGGQRESLRRGGVGPSASAGHAGRSAKSAAVESTDRQGTVWTGLDGGRRA